MDSRFAYLEEDIDAGVFIRARAGLPTHYRQCSHDDNAKAKEFCDRSVKLIYQDNPFIRQLPPYKPDRPTGERSKGSLT